MTYRLITVWRDEEQDHQTIQRSAMDFPAPEAAEAHILVAKERGLIRVDVKEPPMENGINLLTVYIPIHQVIGWFIWLVPDDVVWVNAAHVQKAQETVASRITEEAHLDNH